MFKMVFEIIGLIMVAAIALCMGAFWLDNLMKRRHEKKVRKAFEKQHVFTAVPSHSEDTFRHYLRYVQYEYIAEGRRYFLEKLCAYPAKPVDMFYIKDPGNPIPIAWEEADNGLHWGLLIGACGIATIIFLLLI